MAEGGVEALVLSCNKLAMDHLRAEQFEEAFSLLRRAEDMLKYPDETPGKLRLLAITLNNLGCFYKRSSKPNVALRYLQQALEIEVKTSNDRTNVAGTHLNICAIKSQLGKHDSALQHAKQALYLLSAGFEFTPNSVTTLAIAYHNTGVEYEFLMEVEEAAKAYLSGWDLAKQHLGGSHPLTHSLEKSYRNVTDGKGKSEKGKQTRRLGKRRGSSKTSSSANETALPLIRRATNTSSTNHSSDRPTRRSIGLHSSSPLNSTPIHSQRPRITVTSSTPEDRAPLRTPNSAGTRTLNPLTSKPPLRAINTLRSSKEGCERPPPPSQPIKLVGNKQPRRTVLNIVTASKKQAAAVRIQRHWRGYWVRKQHLRAQRPVMSRKDAERLAHEAIHELEKLKKQVKEDSRKPLLVPVPPKVSQPPSKKPPFKGKRLASIPEVKTEVHLDRLPRLQAHIRGFIARMKYQRMRKAAISIQTQVRKHQVRRLFLSIREAIVFIQTAWRQRRSKV